MFTRENLRPMISAIASLGEVSSIGKTGGMEIPTDGGGDIDIVVYVEKIPEPAARNAVYEEHALKTIRLQEGEGSPLWGSVDFVRIDSVEICIMYHTQRETVRYIEDVLAGNLPDKTHNYFYPTGRIASILTMGIYYDRDGFLASLQGKVQSYPDALSRKLVDYHLGRLTDMEDLERAVSRADSLFFHFAFDLALDHFLQALFAMNYSYFPSRKRTADYIQSFSRKPENCTERLMHIIQLGGVIDGLHEAFMLWQSLVSDLIECAER